MGGLIPLRRLALGAAMAILAVACGAQQGTTAQTDVGVTKDEIKIGATFPVSGSASVYYSVAKGANAYFQYVNTEKGGINGRKINFVVKDDGYLPANTPAKARELVQEEKVFLTYGDLGTPTNLAVRDYYNEQKVPQLFVFTGASFWGADYDKYPWTLGWQPDYITEGKIYSPYILQNFASSKIAILYQNDAYGQDYVTGLKRGLGDKYNSMVVATATYNAGDPPDMKSQVAKLKDSGADLFYVVCTPTYAASAVINAFNTGWKPKIIMNNVAASVSTWRNVIKQLGGKTAAVEGMISTSYLKDPTDTALYGNDAGVKLFRDVMTKYGNGCPADGTDSFCVAGMASAWSLVELLKSAGNTMTRKHVMDLACCSLNQSGDPLLLPGMVVKTTKTDHFPIQQMQLQKWTGDHWTLTGSLIDGRGK